MIADKIQRFSKGNIRFWVQTAFTALCIWIGIEFFLFISYLESGGILGSSFRPPGVEGFLPISSLMSLYLVAVSGEIHPSHPAGMFILVAILTGSFVFGKSFCSWLCPVGFLSEMLGNLGDKVFGRRLKLPRWLDYPFRSIKYLLLGFFVYSIFFLMSSESLIAFLDSPYNITADVKMYYFFANMSNFALLVIVGLILFSIVIRNFWCRYLCPYGALLGVISLISPHKIKRNITSCTDCGLCADVCPSSIKVDKVKTVYSDECTACLSCVDICPVDDTLNYKFAGRKKITPKNIVAASVIGLFVLITGLAMIAGHWHNNITTEEYLWHQNKLQSYGHPTGQSSIEELNRQSETN